jgi:hypothetical protein
MREQTTETNLYATPADRCRIDGIVMDSRPLRPDLEEMQEVSRYASGPNTQLRMPSFSETVWKFSSRPAGPGSLDGNQAYTELHGVHTEFHGGRMMALRAEPALARSAQIIYSV